MERHRPESETAMRALGRALSSRLAIGDVVLLSGELSAGKTTLARGVLEGFGFRGVVRSPTFNLIQLYATSPPVLHADLYRVASAAGLGLEEYLDTHVCLIEWPDRLAGFLDEAAAWRIEITDGESADCREVAIKPPGYRLPSPR